MLKFLRKSTVPVPFCKLLTSLAISMSFAGVNSVSAQTISGIRIGDDVTRLQSIGRSPTATNQAGPFFMQKWEFENGNVFSATTSRAGKVVYMDVEWGGRENGARSDFPGLTFGRTSLADIRKKFGSNGMAFRNRAPAALVEGGIASLNAYEVGSVLVTFVTKVDDYDIEALKKMPNPESSYAELSILVGLVLTDPEYARVNWGGRIYDPAYKPIDWK